MNHAGHIFLSIPGVLLNNLSGNIRTVSMLKKRTYFL